MSRFINIILIALGVFGLVFTWTYYYVKILWIAYVVGLGLAFVAGVTLFWISRSNKTRKEKKQEDKKKVAALKLKLIMDSDSADIFEETFRKNGYSANTVNSHSFVAKKEDGIFVHVNFSFKKLTDQDIVAPLKLAAHYDCPKLYVFCADFDASAKELTKIVKKEICIADINETYRFLKKHGTLPELKDTENVKKPILRLEQETLPLLFLERRFSCAACSDNLFPRIQFGYCVRHACACRLLQIQQAFQSGQRPDVHLTLIAVFRKHGFNGFSGAAAVKTF